MYSIVGYIEIVLTFADMHGFRNILYSSLLNI